MKLYLEINLGVSENSFCSVSDHFHDCNIIDSWIFLKYTYSIESYKFNNKLDCSLRICNEMTNDQIQRINYFFFFYFEKHLMFLQYFYFSPCLSSFFFFFIRIIRIHPKMKNSRVFDNCFLPINIASRVIILKAVSNSKKKKKLWKTIIEKFYSQIDLFLSLSH